MPRNDGLPRNLPRKRRPASDFPVANGEDPCVARPLRDVQADPTKDPRYTRWLRDRVIGQRCQAPWCDRYAQQLHHEPCGSSKTDVSQVGICMQCHADRHEARWAAGYTKAQVVDAYLARAWENWQRYRAEGMR